METTSTWDRLPTIEADRVRLRWLEDADVPRLYSIFSRPEVMRFCSCPPFDDVARARKLLDEIHECFAKRSLFQWGVELRDEQDPSENVVIGTCTLAYIDLSNGRAELGYALHSDHWGRGLMREAVTALIDFAFARLGLRRLEADVDPRHARSIGLLEKLGFVREGFLRERWNVNGEIQDALFYGLLAKEWRATPPAP